MKDVFLGKPFHWLLLCAIVAVCWAMGADRLHVRDFNLFLILLLAASAVLVLAVLRTSRPGEQVTRDPITPEEDD